MANYYLKVDNWLRTFSDGLNPSTIPGFSLEPNTTLGMEEEDPWYWTVDRVIRELCTDDRTWTPQTQTHSKPDPARLERNLREQEVTGSTLLNHVNDELLKSEFEVKILGQRSYLLGAIDELRSKSIKFQLQSSQKNASHISASHGGHGQQFSPYGLPPGFQQPAPYLTTPQPRYDLPSQLTPDTSKIPHPHLHGGQYPATPTPEGTRVPGADFVFTDAAGNKRLKIAPSGQEDVQIPEKDMDMYQKNADDQPFALPPANDSSTKQDLNANCDLNGKKRKRIAPTFVSAVIDEDRNREVPTNADHVILYEPDSIEMEPGVPFTDENGRKRLVPVHQPVPGNYDSLLQGTQVVQNQVLNNGGKNALKAAELIVQKMETDKAKLASNLLPFGYLGKKKMSIDSIFYPDIAIQEELPRSEIETTFSENRHEISSGRRLYVHRAIKHFLTTESKVFVRNKKVFYANMPYPIVLAPKHTSASFTLHYKNDNGCTISQREALSSWPEVDPEAPKHTSDDKHAVFSVGLSELAVNQHQFDPDSLEKYRFIPGGDEVLPLYGESDEENEYDEETWRDMEKERHEKGEKLDRLLKPVKNKLITLQETNEAIDEAIAEMIVDWNKQKLPKKEHKAFRLWTKCHKKPAFRIEKLKTIQSRLAHLNDDRIPKLRKEIVGLNWSSQLQVRKQARSMEQSIYEREGLIWMQSTILQKTAPEKLPPRAPASKKTVVSSVVDDDEDGESIGSVEDTSSSDDDMDDFIVNDGDEEIELNLADSEGEAIESEVDEEDTAMIDADESILDDAIKSGVVRPEPLTESRVATSSGQGEPMIDASASVGASSPEKESNVLRSTPKKPPLLIDLTMSSSSGGEQSRLDDLATPTKKKTTIKLKISPKVNSPILISDGDNLSSPVPDISNLPRMDDPVSIAKYPYHQWTKLGDRARLVIAILQNGFRIGQRVKIICMASSTPMADLWFNMSQTIEAVASNQEGSVKGMYPDTFQTCKYFLRLFWIYITCKNQKLIYLKNAKEFIEKNYDRFFQGFYKLCKTFESCFGAPVPPSIKDDEESDDDEEPQSAIRRQVNASSDDPLQLESPSKKKKPRKLLENAAARDLRLNAQQRQAAQELRRAELRNKLAKSEAYTSQHDHIIINEGKFEHHGLVHVNEDIGRRIKPHQIEGVRFMWNQIVTDENKGQGCLLAHTMGLGKTMQVITLLVAISETSQSAEKNMYSQIPKRLRASKTVVLCPPALVDNWMDELLLWAPKGVLGELWKIDATNPVEDRLDIIQDWYHNGGVLVIGYDIFTRLTRDDTSEEDGAILNHEQHKEAKKCLLNGPSIIVADEAHKMKNPKALVTKAASGFKSMSRIALTGSPLANNVEEYFSMINWVAPNYLGPMNEFREKYANPIQAGLYSDSNSRDKRQSLKWLEILKEDVAPKINRADMSVISDDLPPKQEFVITVPLTELQIKAYIIYVKEMLVSKHSVTKDGQVSLATMWSWLAILSLICNHPQCFSARLNLRKEEAKNKNRSTEQQESTETDDQLGTGVSRRLLEQTNALFASNAPDLTAPELSNKVKILLQILDASKAIGDKVLVFSQSLPTLDFLEDICKVQGRKYARLDGKTQSSKRQARVKKFNVGDDEVYLISTNAGGLGLNLQGANRVVIFDFKFNPIQEQQAIGRAWRLGQKKNVFVYRLVSGGTFETLVHNKTIFKMQLASRVVDKKSPLARATSKPADYLFEPKNVERQDLSEFQKMDPYILDEILASQTICRTICSIVQSDTFEIEDEDKLTPAERVEVKQLRADEHLRQRDKDEYLRVMQQRRAQENAVAARQAAINRTNMHGQPVHAIPNGSSSLPNSQSSQRILPPASSGDVNSLTSKDIIGVIRPKDSVVANHKEPPGGTPANATVSSTGFNKIQVPKSNSASVNGSNLVTQKGSNNKLVQDEASSTPRKFFSFDSALRAEFSKVLSNTLGEYAKLVNTQKRGPEDRLASPILRELVSKLHGNSGAIYEMTKVAINSLRARKDEFRTAFGTGQMTPSDFVQGIINQGQIVDNSSSTPKNSTLLDNSKSPTPTPSLAASIPEDIHNSKLYQAMARPAQPQRSLREPVTKPKKSLSKNGSFQLKRKQSERESHHPQSANRPLPQWAREEIQEGKSGRNRGNSSCPLRASSEKD